MSVKRQFWVYIMTNRWNTVLYIGVTNNITRRVVQHKSGKGGMFTRKYNIGKLVYFEMTDDILSAIRREKQLKAGSREEKNALITSVNPEWRDLSDDAFQGHWENPRQSRGDPGPPQPGRAKQSLSIKGEIASSLCSSQ